MCGEPGTGGSYNTSPWYGPGDQWGGGASNNDTVQAQNGAINAGQSAANQYGLTTGGSSQPQMQEPNTGDNGVNADSGVGSIGNDFGIGGALPARQ